MTSIDVDRVIRCSGSAADGTVTIDVQLKDGSTPHVRLAAPVAIGLVSFLHQASTRLADILAQGKTPLGQTQAHTPQSVRMGHDVATKTALLQFDQGEPSQAAY